MALPGLNYWFFQGIYWVGTGGYVPGTYWPYWAGRGGYVRRNAPVGGVPAVPGSAPVPRIPGQIIREGV
jgi:hypothetical protein